MFFSVNSNEAGFKEEALFFSLLKEAFESEEAFAFQQFPFNSPNEAFRYESDVLFFHKNLGLFIFEVKSIRIHQIKGIRGTEWHCESSSGPYTMNPQKQAENQMFYTRNLLNERCMLHNLINSHAFVVLPNISYAEWEAREDLQKEFIKRPILKEDLENPVILYEKIRAIANTWTIKHLDDFKWQEVLDYFTISSENMASASETSRFSELHLIKSIPHDFEETLQVKLVQGIKLYVLCEQRFPDALKVIFRSFIKEFQLLVYEETKGVTFTQNEIFVDGAIATDRLAELEHAFPHFNTGQYAIIHVPHNQHLSVSAGAGTGKTHVMVDRVLFLLMKEQIPLEQIDMITFTNASTNEMKQRLEKRLLTMFKLTKKAVFLNYAEDVSTMEISTIHSFAKRIIQTLAHELGFGSELALRSFKYEKQKIIFDILDEHFATQSTQQFLSTNIRYYDFVSILLDMWEEMEKKGLSEKEILYLDFGQATGQSELFHEIIVKVFHTCENRLDKIKKEQQAISMGDLIRKLKDFATKDDALKQLAPSKYLFVDEFQDSDDVQIAFIAKLQEILDYKIFVVGDIKQAIYRFRGADYRAFVELEKRLTKPFKPFNLRHNYRTSSVLLKRFHKLFIRWGQSANEDLSYTEDDCLTSNIPSRTTEWHIGKYDKKNINIGEKNSEMLSEHVRTLGDGEKLAILIRTNRHAREMKELCDELNIATVQNLDGQFYLCDAVKHFYSLLLALQYPNQPMYVLEALKTPYFGYEINEQNFIATQGNTNRLQKFLRDHIGTTFEKYALQVRDYSPLTIVQVIMREQNFYSRIHDYYNKQKLSPDEKEIAIARYNANIRHLLTIIEQQFATNATTIPIISNWLDVQMKTNRTENEPTFESDAAKVVISTVHRSKGLQYHTVFLPLTNKPYNSIQPQYFVEDGATLKKEHERRFGWRIHNFENNYYNSLNDVENDETRKEEVRLLYVALTRAEQKVIITLPTYNVQNTWSALLKEAGILGED